MLYIPIYQYIPAPFSQFRTLSHSTDIIYDRLESHNPRPLFSTKNRIHGTNKTGNPYKQSRQIHHRVRGHLDRVLSRVIA